MWQELSLPWQVALHGAWQAYRAGSLPIGAVIVGPDNSVLAAGRNRLYEPRRATSQSLSGARIGHAEINALLALDGQPVNPKECTLYTTTEPCPMCAGAIVMANVRRVCYAARDPWAGATELYQLSGYMRGKNMLVEGPLERENGVALEMLLIALQTEAFLRHESERSRGDPLVKLNAVVDSMAALCPQGVALGRELFRGGALQALCRHGASAAVMVEEIEKRLRVAL